MNHDQLIIEFDQVLFSNISLNSFNKKYHNYSKKNIKGNLGFEAIFTNDTTLSLNYERFQHLDFDRSGKTETFIVKIGKIIEGDSEFAFNYDPLNDHESSLSYNKNINGFDFSINHNHIFDNSLEYDTNIEVSSSF